MSPPSVIIIRHPKERRSKCSLQPLRDRPGLFFFNARPGFRYDAGGHLLLAVDAPVVSPGDAELPAEERMDVAHRLAAQGVSGACDLRPLLLLDATWRLLPQVESCIENLDTSLPRSLPEELTSAYPRVSKISADPGSGLASVEALYAALRILGWRDDSLLDDYHWREAFLASFPF